ncbi:hypothetical protein Tco_0924701 [Tanacetum coccineum]|uniref:Uncharacterized protein n=1 Tax=Tanacetum coccineum TaxID=301880 RepID=A0ABQ5D610_9ASTR
MVARKPKAKEGGKKKTASEVEKPKPVKEKTPKPAPAKQPKPIKEKTSNPPPLKKARKGKAQHQVHVGGVAIREHVPETTQKLPEVEGKGKAFVTDKQAARSLLDLHKPKRRSTMDQYILYRRIPIIEEASTGPFTQPQNDISEKMIQDTSSPADSTNITEKGAGSERINSGT